MVIAGHAFVQNLRRGHYELRSTSRSPGVWQWHSASWHWRSEARLCRDFTMPQTDQMQQRPAHHERVEQLRAGLHAAEATKQ